MSDTCDHVTAAPCHCGSCCVDELPVSPFLALRVAYGMLLGESEFQTLMGNPRGKHMLHAAWLHGPGVIWGLDVRVEGVRTLRVTDGLAVDGLGRELRRETAWCRDVRDWLREQDLPAPQPDCREFTVRACVVAEFDCRPTSPVPTLADPCDVTRRHDTDSRIEETTRIVLRPGPCPCPCRSQPYHRVRVLLGLDEVGDDDEAGAEAVEARHAVARSEAHCRAAELLRQFRRMAAADVAQLRPATEQGAEHPTLFPVLEDDAGVVLACVEIDVRAADDCPEVVEVRPDGACRTALLPNTTIQELLCGLAPGLIDERAADSGSPRVVDETPEWSAEDSTFSIKVTAPLHEGTVRRRALRMTSLPLEGSDGWVDEDIEDVTWNAADMQIVVRMADRPVNEIVRLVVNGTGSRPVLGTDPPLPLAGLVGDPPVGRHHGRDAVLTFPNPTLANPYTERRAEP